MTKSEVFSRLIGVYYESVKNVAKKYGIKVDVYEEELLASIARHHKCEQIIKEILTNEAQWIKNI